MREKLTEKAAAYKHMQEAYERMERNEETYRGLCADRSLAIPSLRAKVSDGVYSSLKIHDAFSSLENAEGIGIFNP